MPSEEKRELTPLEKCGIFAIAIAMRNGMPMPAASLQDNMGMLENDSGLTAEEIRDTYKFISDSAFNNSIPQKNKSIGFKQ